MQSRFFLFSLAISVFFLFSLATGYARPEFAQSGLEEKFTQMDSDKNGELSQEEFFAALPSMRVEAFSKIDEDKNGSISLAEWLNFMGSHAMGMKGQGEAAMGAHNATEMEAAKKKASKSQERKSGASSLERNQKRENMLLDNK